MPFDIGKIAVSVVTGASGEAKGGIEKLVVSAVTGASNGAAGGVEKLAVSAVVFQNQFLLGQAGIGAARAYAIMGGAIGLGSVNKGVSYVVFGLVENVVTVPKPSIINA